MKFSHTPGRMFTILRGSNGSGKTNIMNAITWCLYGKEKYHDTDQTSLPIINKDVLINKPSGLVDMSVELNLVNESGSKIRIERRLSLLNNNQTEMEVDNEYGILIPKKSTPSVLERYSWFDPKRGGWKTTEYFATEIKALLPEDLFRYFLFDGEQLEEFFENIDGVRKGIEDVSQIEIMQHAINELHRIIQEKSKNNKKLDPKIKDYEEKESKLKSDIANIDSETDVLDADQNAKQKRVEEIYILLGKPEGIISDLGDKAKSIQQDIKIKEEEYRDIEREIKEYVLEHAAYAQAHSAIDAALKIIREKGNTGLLPVEIRDTFLQKLLADNQCICGNDISAGEPRRLVEQRLLNKAQYTSISEICTNLLYELESTNIHNIKTGLDDQERKLSSIDEQLNELGREQKEVEAQLGRVGPTEIQKLLDEKNELGNEIQKISEEKGRKGIVKENLEMERRENQTALRKAYKENKKRDYITRQLQLCRESSAYLELTKNNLIQNVRIEVQKYTKKYFLEFLWKKSAYVDVNISEEYEITAIDANHHGVRGGLSKGQKLILALAFMAALRKITGFGFPLIIDTPLGRVSGETRYNIARTLPTFLQYDQVILLVTDSEYQAQIRDEQNQEVFPSVHSILSEHVGLDYDIIFNNDMSEVREHA